MAQVFSCEFCEIFMNTFCRRTTLFASLCCCITKFLNIYLINFVRMSRIYLRKGPIYFWKKIDHLLQWFQSQFSFNKKLHFTQGCCLPREISIKLLIVAGSNCNKYSWQFQQSHNTLVIERSKFKNSTANNEKKKIDATKNANSFLGSSVQSASIQTMHPESSFSNMP